MIEVKKKMTSEALADISTFLSRYSDNSDAGEIKELESQLTANK